MRSTTCSRVASAAQAVVEAAMPTSARRLLLAGDVDRRARVVADEDGRQPGRAPVLGRELGHALADLGAHARRHGLAVDHRCSHAAAEATDGGCASSAKAHVRRRSPSTTWGSPLATSRASARWYETVFGMTRVHADAWPDVDGGHAARPLRRARSASPCSARARAVAPRPAEPADPNEHVALALDRCATSTQARSATSIASGSPYEVWDHGICDSLYLVPIPRATRSS